MQGKSAAIVQSSYIPWKGYFDIINSVDEFIFYDDVQYTRRDWRNRNRIKSKDGAQWLTIPVGSKGRYYQKMSETQISDPRWTHKHWEKIRHSYARAPYFRAHEELFSTLYLGCTFEFLSEINRHFVDAICRLLGITTRISWSSAYMLPEGRNERLISLCHQVSAVKYLSGPAARAYIDENQFRSAGIAVSFVDYSGYPEYPQLFPPFEHHVTILDLVLNVGPEAPRYMKSFRGAIHG